jgi:hypothetical protein
MDATCLAHCLTEEEGSGFENNGYLVIDDVLSPQQVRDLTTAASPIVAEYRRARGIDDHVTANPFDYIGRDELFLDLVDWPLTFPKIWGILGWHIQLYHTHMMTVPPEPRLESGYKRLGWHQDSGRLNQDFETNPRPRVSVKIGYFLADTTEPESGSVYVVPGSHLRNELQFPDGDESEPTDAVALQVPAGSAIIFDRRLWHASGRNHSSTTRIVLYYGYSYRWLKQRDDMTVGHLLDRCDPIRRQLLGHSVSGNHSFTSPRDEDVPLREWIREHLGEDAVIP